MESDPYENLADHYDWMTQKDLEREEFFRQLFKDHRICDVLDCACGTGMDLMMFHSFGCNVMGSDLSDAMLIRARKNLSEAGREIPVRKVDFRKLEKSYTAQFDAVVCLSNAINEVLDEEGLRRALRSMKAVLRPGGILVFDQGQSDAMMKNPPKFDPVINNRDFSRLFVLEYSGNLMKVNIFDFVHTEENSTFYAASVNVAIRLKDDWDRLLSKTGFNNVECFGDFKFSTYDKESSRRLIAIAQK
ncbi:class I SAM-dependent methyltransferase [Desulfomonile tiedjei]|uniref:Methyltransferase family protein n=1 Tax=Desulfomonile tiedjei (strain ATCC 49306 / DSM 6799 / DCB-1) TaxID=706587 RepID=I4C1A9_DESTA|nr:class I SAM-dependent methyltransferase [Desulfomonile tiedjei]AFM23350.1 methyltransferase family protein [Desulfomonile tiedjei DSM 6799]